MTGKLGIKDAGVTAAKLAAGALDSFALSSWFHFY